MRDSASVMDMKNNAMGAKGKNLNSSDASSSSGFKAHHLMIVGVMGLMVGAYIQLYYFNGAKTV